MLYSSDGGLALTSKEESRASRRNLWEGSRVGDRGADERVGTIGYVLGSAWPFGEGGKQDPLAILRKVRVRTERATYHRVLRVLEYTVGQ